MYYFNKSEDYSELINQLALYRDSHDLDRAATQAVQLLVDDLVSNLSGKRSEELREQTKIDESKKHTENLDDIIMGYGIPDDWNSPEDIVLTLASDKYIDATNEDEYYRALEAAERYVAEYCNQWDGLQ
jgi:hypothetical protein